MSIIRKIQPRKTVVFILVLSMLVVSFSGCIESEVTCPTCGGTGTVEVQKTRQVSYQDVVQVPHERQVAYTEQEAYQRYVKYTVVSSLSDWIWLSLSQGYGLRMTVRIENIDSAGGTFTVDYRVDDIGGVCYIDTVSHYVGSGEVKDFVSIFDGEVDRDYRWYKTVHAPTTTDYRTVTKYRTETYYTTETVTKYRTESYTVTETCSVCGGKGTIKSSASVPTPTSTPTSTPTPYPSPTPTPTPTPSTTKSAQAIKEAIDYDNPITRNFAVQLAAEYPGEYNIGQICSIYEYIRGEWRYVSDPSGQEYFAYASESIENGLVGDCDDFAILMAATIEAIGGGSRVILASGPEGAHAYAEVYVGPEEAELTQKILQDLANKYYTRINYQVDSGGRVWLNLDWTATHPGGPFFEGTIVDRIYP